MAQLSANSASLAGTYYRPEWSPPLVVNGQVKQQSPQGYPIAGGGTYQPQVKGASTFNPTPTLGSTQLGPNLPAGGNGGGNGGGGGGNPSPQPQPYYDNSTGRTFNSQGDFMNEVNGAFGDASNILDQQEQRIRGGEQDLYTQATSPYDSTLPLLQQARDENLNRNTQQVGETRQSYQSALDAARNLYNELRQGSQQRFGGSSSAGEFAYNLLGREQQRNYGQLQNQEGQNIQKLSQQANEIVKGYQAQYQQLNTQKEAALAQARDTFRQQLSQIDSARFGLAQNKAQAKLQALYQLRSEAQNIQNSFVQLQQQMTANAQQAYLQTVSQVQAYRGQTGGQVQLDPFLAASGPRFGGGQIQGDGGFQGSVGTGKRFNPQTGRYE